MVSQELLLWIVWDIKHLLPQLRSSALVQRVCRHGIVDPDRIFGVIERTQRAALVGAPCPNCRTLRENIMRMMKRSKINKGNV